MLTYLWAGEADKAGAIHSSVLAVCSELGKRVFHVPVSEAEQMMGRAPTNDGDHMSIIWPSNEKAA